MRLREVAQQRRQAEARILRRGRWSVRGSRPLRINRSR